MGKSTTTQAAAALNVTERRVRQLAEEMGLERFGRGFVITDKDIEKMRKRKTQRGPEKRRTK